MHPPSTSTLPHHVTSLVVHMTFLHALNHTCTRNVLSRASLFPGPGMSFFRPRDLFQPRKVFFLASVFFQASLRGPKKTNVFLTTLFAAVKEGTTVFFSTPQRLVTDPASFSGPRNVFFSAFAEHKELQKGGVKCCCSIASEQVQFTTLNSKP